MSIVPWTRFVIGKTSVVAGGRGEGGSVSAYHTCTQTNVFRATYTHAFGIIDVWILSIQLISSLGNRGALVLCGLSASPDECWCGRARHSLLSWFVCCLLYSTHTHTHTISLSLSLSLSLSFCLSVYLSLFLSVYLSFSLL